MVVVSEIEVAAEEFRFGRTLTADLEVEVYIEPIVPTAGRIAPYVWIDGPDADVFENHVAGSDVVESVVELERTNGRTLYRIDWDDPSECLLAGLRESGASVLDARGADRWTFNVRFPSREALSTLHNYCNERDISLSIVRIRSSDSASPDRLGLTPEQRQALELATERGYFAVPREVTLSELADELDISAQAVSERIRRGTGAALRSVVGNDTSSE